MIRRLGNCAPVAPPSLRPWLPARQWQTFRFTPKLVSDIFSWRWQLLLSASFLARCCFSDWLKQPWSWDPECRTTCLDFCYRLLKPCKWPVLAHCRYCIAELWKLTIRTHLCCSVFDFIVACLWYEIHHDIPKTCFKLCVTNQSNTRQSVLFRWGAPSHL